MPFGGSEMLIVMIVLLLLFGGSQLPKLARSIGEARKELRDATREE
jgi:sec-independent protein translocase protein TatA